ncbi:MAG: hypothetical protein ACRD2Z_13330 [Thermoanaerobaculia bacterium]
MPQGDDRLKEELLETDDEFRHLVEEHKRSEQRLDELQNRSMLSPENEVEEKQIKLHKLYLKDQMEQILRRRRETHVSA